MRPGLSAMSLMQLLAGGGKSLGHRKRPRLMALPARQLHRQPADPGDQPAPVRHVRAEHGDHPARDHHVRPAELDPDGRLPHQGAGLSSLTSIPVTNLLVILVGMSLAATVLAW